MTFYGDEADIAYLAEVVGRDPLTDSALIQLTEKPKRELTEVKFGDSAQMQPGDWVMAIGNPFGLAHTVSVGVISATERPFPITDGRSQDVLQTDAAINPGNSGGPLLNVRGEVVGVNTAIYTDSRQQGNIGIGFAIPINTVRELLPQLRAGKVTRGVIGISVGTIPLDALEELGLKERTGALVSSVNSGGPASKAGVEPGDVILEYNGKPVHNRDELVGMVVRTKPGTTVPVKVLRDKVEKRLNITVDELNLETETARSAAPNAEPDEEAGEGFGMTMTALTADIARRLRLPTDTQGVVITEVENGGTAQRAGLTRATCCCRSTAGRWPRWPRPARELGRVASGSTAFLLVLRNGQESSSRCARSRRAGPRRRTRGQAPLSECRGRPTARPCARRCALRPRRLQHDVLVDTGDGRLQAAGSTLRVRADGDRAYPHLQGAGHPGSVQDARGDRDRGRGLRTTAGHPRRPRFRAGLPQREVPRGIRGRGAVIAIDDTPIGTFVEIEGEAAAIVTLAGRLGFEPADFVPASYRVLFAAAGPPGAPADTLFVDADPDVIDTALRARCRSRHQAGAAVGHPRQGGTAGGRHRAHPAAVAVAGGRRHHPRRRQPAPSAGDDDPGGRPRRRPRRRRQYSWEPIVMGSAGGPRRALDLIDRDRFIDRERRHDDRSQSGRPLGRARGGPATGDAGRVADVLAGYNALVADSAGCWLGCVQPARRRRASPTRRISSASRLSSAAPSPRCPPTAPATRCPALSRASAAGPRQRPRVDERRDLSRRPDARRLSGTVRIVARAEQCPLDRGARTSIAASATVEDSICWDNVCIGRAPR